jgi:hypothetical protein
MANRPSLIQRKQKKTRVTRNEAYLVNLKYMGTEPTHNGEISNVEYIKTLNWYNTMSDIKEAREFFNSYLKQNDRLEDIKLLKRVPDSFIPLTAAWLCRMAERGYSIKEKDILFIEGRLKSAFSHIEPVKEQEKKGEVVSIQDRIKEKASDIIAEIEQIVDSRDSMRDFSLYEWLKGKQIPATYSSVIIKAYQGWLNELLDAYEGGDPDLKEGYRRQTKPEIAQDIVFFSMIVEDAQKYGDVTKKLRAPRKPRTISIDKKIKGLKFQKEDKEFKIASINPEKIIGASELWTFNTKYKTLTVFRAADRGGLQVKGTSIINYDEANSVTKRTGRKAEYFVERVLNGGKIVLRKLTEEEGIGSETPLANRINENTILLKIV